MSEDIIPSRMASPGGAISGGYGIMSAGKESVEENTDV